MHAQMPAPAYFTFTDEKNEENTWTQEVLEAHLSGELRIENESEMPQFLDITVDFKNQILESLNPALRTITADVCSSQFYIGRNEDNTAKFCLPIFAYKAPYPEPPRIGNYWEFCPPAQKFVISLLDIDESIAVSNGAIYGSENLILFLLKTGDTGHYYIHGSNGKFSAHVPTSFRPENIKPENLGFLDKLFFSPTKASRESMQNFLDFCNETGLVVYAKTKYGAEPIQRITP